MTTTSGTADWVLSGLTLVTALGAGLSAGVFLAFSSFVMAGLARTPEADGVRAMQEINRAAPNPVFMVTLFGTALLAVVLAVVAIAAGAPGRWLVVAGALSYLVCIGLTVAYHVPRNDALATLDPGAPGTVETWRAYLTDWTRLNHVRTVSAAVGCLLLLLGRGAS
jgi:uncharacterized membrane protein